MHLDIQKFQTILLDSFTNTKYNFLFGSEELKPTAWIEVDTVVIPPSRTEDYENIARVFKMLMMVEILKHVKTNRYFYNVGVPFVKHEKVWYFTPLQELYDEDHDGIHFVPMLGESCTFTTDKSISDLENWIQSITFKDNHLSLKLPLYL